MNFIFLKVAEHKFVLESFEMNQVFLHYLELSRNICKHFCDIQYSIPHILSELGMHYEDEQCV